MPDRICPRYFSPLNAVRAVECTKRGIRVKVDNKVLEVDVIREDVFRIQIAGGDFVSHPTFAVCADLTTLPLCRFEVGELDNDITVQTTAMLLSISRAPFSLSAFRPDGSVIFGTAVVDGVPAAYLHLNDEFIVARQMRPADVIFGLGEKTGRMNRAGRSFTLWNTDVLNPNAAGEFANGRDRSDPRADPTSTEFDPYYVSIPFFYHVDSRTNSAAGFFIDNGHRAEFEFDHPSEYRFKFLGGQYTEYIFAGPALKQIVEAYTWLTGRISTPPIWALGYHQCRWHPYDHNSLTDLANNLRDRQIPCDTLWLDIDHMDGYRVFTWNSAAFPNVTQTLKNLKSDGFNVVTIVDPGVKQETGYSVFESGLDENVFCKTIGGNVYTGQVWPGKTAFPDFSKESARRWWGDLNANHIATGVAGIWNDMNEPATGDIPARSMHFQDGRVPHEVFHNQYALMMAMATHDGLVDAMPDRRPFILSRAGSAGIQRYAANWMGDNMSRWDHLKMSIAMGMGLGLSGQPFVGADVGGFAENCTEELLIRWMQYGALTPFFRNHNMAGCAAQYPWTFGGVAEENVRKSIELRYRLMPYLYTAFVEAAESGAPIQRPLFYEYQDDETTRAVDDQFLLGRDIMIAPVYQPGTESRSVYLPKGDWFDWYSDECLRGGRYVDVETPLDIIPLFVRAGAIIPMWPDAPASTMDYQPTIIDLHIFTPSKDGTSTSVLVEDDGVSCAYKSGQYHRTEFCLKRLGSKVNLTSSISGTGYPEFQRKSFSLVLHGGEGIQEISENGKLCEISRGKVLI